MIQIYDLKTEYRTNPVGLDNPSPRFSWKLKAAEGLQNVMQESYRIRAWEGDTLLWDSGRVESADSQRVRYGGRPAGCQGQPGAGRGDSRDQPGAGREDRQGLLLASRMRVEWQVEVAARDGEGTMYRTVSDKAFFVMGLLRKEDWKCNWIEPETEVDHDARKPAPYLRRSFRVKKGLKQAWIFQTAHGLYEFWVNGMAGTQERFKPGLTSYYHRIQYQMYDITSLLQEEENVWAVMLGDGWWRGVTGGTVKNNFGYKLHFYGQIELLYEDGSREIIGTGEEFKTAFGGLLASDMQMGDIYDAGTEPEGWKCPGFDDSHWEQAHEVHMSAELIPSRSVPVLDRECFEARPFRDSSGNLVLDFGQNIAGYVRMKLRDCEKGQRIRLVHGEDIDAEGRFSTANIDKPVLPLEAFQEVSYICKGQDMEEYCPIFSVFGFRYVLLEGYEEVKIRPGDFTALAVYSAMEETGDFTCSNPLINKLVENSRWSQKGNFLDVAVDCPTRERNAWTGDNQIYVRTATDFMNVYPFYEKWMQDQAIEQYASGKVGITFPSTSSVHNPREVAAARTLNPTFAQAGPEGEGNIGEDCAGWGDSAVWIPYILYLCYGDLQILKNQYQTARRWVDYMLSCAREHNPIYADQPQYHWETDGELDGEYIYDTRMHYGEWQEPIPKEDSGESAGEVFARWIREGRPLVATAYMCRSAENVARMASVLGKEEDAAFYGKKAQRIRRVYDRYLIGEDGSIEPGHQAAYVRALAMDLCSEGKRPEVEAQLVKEIERNGYRLNTGFLSTPFLLPVLVDMGREDLAFRLLEQTENPSWLHPVLLGSTTIPESWNSFDVHQASYNHYSYGAVCEFLFGYVAGIRPLWEKPGYEEFELKPLAGGSLTWVKCRYESLYGTIVSGWELKKGKMLYYCRLPVNTRAHVILPNGREEWLGSGEYHFVVPQI